MKKIMAAFVVFALMTGMLTGCGGAQESNPGAENETVHKIGVVQFVEHPALDSAYQGFVDGLKEAGFTDGENIKIDMQNAQGEQANCNTIADKLINNQSDLILAIATPAAQAVANATTDIPVVITAVTDPVSAKLVESNEAPGGNVTGTSDLNPCTEQMDLLKKLVPDAKTVGMLYCSSETNSKFQVDLATEAAEKLGLNVLEFTVSNSNEIQQVVESMIGKVDVIYAPTDNMISAGMAAVASVATAGKVPIIVGEEAQVDNGGLATYGISYYELGKQTGAMAARILNGENPAEMPIEYAKNLTPKYNEEVAKELGITLPQE